MIAAIDEVTRKIRKDGLIRALKAAGRRLHSMAFSPNLNPELVPSVLDSILREKGALTLVQIGANVGNTETDQLYSFLSRHCRRESSVTPKVRALLVEPVRHLFHELLANYAEFKGVVCENVAITEAAGTKPFYRLREGIDLSKYGLPHFAEELGSFLPERMDNLWSHDPENLQLREFVKANIVVEPVLCMTLHQLLQKHDIKALDFIIVDTEGYDYQIIRAIDFNRLRPNFINYERIHLNESEPDCRELLIRQGYCLRDHGQDTLAEFQSKLSLATRVRERLYNRWLRLIREPRPNADQPHF